MQWIACVEQKMRQEPAEPNFVSSATTTSVFFQSSKGRIHVHGSVHCASYRSGVVTFHHELPRTTSFRFESAPRRLSSTLSEEVSRHLQPIGKGNFGRPFQLLLRLINLQIAVVNFSRTLHSVDWLKGLDTKRSGNCRKDLIVGSGLPESNVEDLSIALFQRLHVGMSDVCHVNVVAGVFAIAKYLWSFLGEHLLAKNGHHSRVTFRTLAWAVHISIADHNILQPVQQAIIK